MNRLKGSAISLVLALASAAALAGQYEGKPQVAAVTTSPAAVHSAPAPAVPAAVVANAPPAADKVYPPLPSLSMLPPSTGPDETPAPRGSSRRRTASATARKAEMPSVRLVVSDASHAYLDSVEHQIDQALLK
ncbi:hypothetical protein [Pararobbsia alpina]|uniref:Uncharacterized protein n=1 Tax=Pararobbsia alpina TaxID=621374 RepID=A0A6S7B2Q9_9BURK|nr:hypothetical protein [Pararobbsia alpina]CAB3785207.1 hypothetical protein LMG28138_01983 [Pararobbsia alpina]